MKQFLISLLFAIVCCVGVSAQPGTVQFPTALDDTESLFGHLTDQPLTTLNGTITGSSTTITVFSTAAFGATGSLVIGSEIIYYTGKTGTTFTGCLRGRDGTAAVTHGIGSLVRSPVLSVHHRKQTEAIIAIETKLGFGSSDASSAATGACLRKNADGTTSWQSCPAGGGGGGGITNSAGNNVIMKSDGTNAVGSDISNTSTAITIAVSRPLVLDGGTVDPWLPNIAGIIQGRDSALYLGRNADLHLVSRAYYDNSPSWKYMTTGPAASVHLLAGDILLRTAVSGTADTTLSWVDKWVFKNAGQAQVTNIAAPATPSAGTTALWPDSTDKVFKGKDDAGNTSVMVRPDAGASNNFLTGITTAGAITKAQPAFSNLSGSATDAQVPDTITINGTNNVSWPSVNKSGSSLADLAQRTIAQLAASTSANLAGVLSDEVGTDKVVFNTDPNFVTKLTINSASGIADVDAGAQQTGNVLKVYDSAAGADNLGWLWARRMELGNMLTGSSTVYSPGSVPFGGGNFYQNLRSVQRVNGDPNTFDKWQNLVAWTNIESLTAPHSASIDIYGLEAGVGVIDTSNTHDLWTIFGTHSAAFLKGAGDIDDGLIGVMGKSQAFGSGVIQKHRAVQGWVSSQTGATGSSVLAQGVYGLVSNVSGYTMTTAVAGDFLIDSNAGTIGNAYVVRVRAETTGAGTVSTNRYGLYIADQNVGTVSGTIYNFFSAGTGRKNTIEGHLDLGQYIEFAGISAPAVSPSGKARMFFNGTKFRCSENAGSYVDCIGAGGGGSGDMILANAQTNTGAKTFADATLLLQGGDYGASDGSLPGSPVEKAFYLNTHASSRKLFLYNDGAYREILQVGKSFVNLTSNVTGTLPVANGGTGQPSLTANNVILGNGTSAVQFVAPGTSGNVLTSNGTTWTSAAASGGGGSFVDSQFRIVGSCLAGSFAPTTFDLYRGASTPAGNCRGSAIERGVLSFDQNNNVYAHFVIPSGWTSGAMSVVLRGEEDATTATAAFDIQTLCRANGEAIEGTFNTAQNASVATTANSAWMITQTSLTVTGCAAGESLYVKVQRTDAGDTTHLLGVELRATVP